MRFRYVLAAAAVAVGFAFVGCDGGDGGNGGNGVTGDIVLTRMINGQNLYRVQADGSNPVQIGSGQWPDWSPDGTRIAYGANVNGNHGIFVMNADGSNVRQVTPGDRSCWTPSWGPNGQRIVFRIGDVGQGELADIAVINADGSGLQKLTDQQTDWMPSWSPDGTKIAFIRTQLDPEGGYNLCLMDPDGSNVEVIQSDVIASNVTPAWSPDSSQLAFRRNTLQEGPGIAVVDRDGSDVTQLTEDDDLAPTWSPDGSQIMFARAEDPDGAPEDMWGVYLMNADGSNVQKVLDNAFSPDWRTG